MAENRLYDKHGCPIYPGDLLKTFHFIGARRKRHYLYHVAVEREGHMEMVPVSHLEPSKARGGGRCWLSEAIAAGTEVIHGHGPGDCLSFEDREHRTEGTQP